MAADQPRPATGCVDMQLPESVFQGPLSLISGSSACANATYNHRIDDPNGYNFCAVPNTGFDVSYTAPA